MWLEGGPTVAAAFMAAGLVDEVVAYVAPGPAGPGRPSVSDLGITTIDHALRLHADRHHPHRAATCGSPPRSRESA